MLLLRRRSLRLSGAIGSPAWDASTWLVATTLRSVTTSERPWSRSWAKAGYPRHHNMNRHIRTRMKVPQYSEAEIRCVLQYRHYYKSARLEKLARPVKKNEQQSSWTKPSIRAAAGSGFSPGPFAPLMGIQGMVTRTGRDGETWGANQRISV